MTDSQNSLHVLVLAAGYGTRLHPITETIPKPLLPLVDQSLFAFQLRALQPLTQSGIAFQLHANAHHLYNQVQTHAESLGARVWVEMPYILGTGGPLHRMRQQGLRGELLVVNGDNRHQFDLLQFLSRARNSKAPVVLLAGSDPQIDTLMLGEENNGLCPLQCLHGRWNKEENVDLQRTTKVGVQRATFTGISWYADQAWNDIRAEETDIRDFWKRTEVLVDVSQKEKSWQDIGTPQGYLEATKAELAQRKMHYYCDPTAQVNGLVVRSVVAQGAIVPKDAVVEDSVVLPGTELGAKEHLQHTIAYGAWRWRAHPTPCQSVLESLRTLGVAPDAQQNEVLSELQWQSAGSAGSGRSYWRITAQDAKSWVLQQSHDQDADWHRFVLYARTLLELGLPVPCLYAVDETARQVLQEDLGGVRLWDHVKANPQMVQEAYRSVLQALTTWQMQSTQAFARCPEFMDRAFDFKGLRWETEYFSEHYLCGYRHMTTQEPHYQQLQKHYDALATSVAAHPRGLVHRDFQSHNIMVHKGRMVFIDFQGARPGSLYYDVASLLWDPYVMLPYATVMELFDEWTMHHPLLWELGKERNRANFYDASQQRIMQALGAYCNLSRNKGISSFAQYIEPGEQRLAEVLGLVNAEGAAC